MRKKDDIRWEWSRRDWYWSLLVCVGAASRWASLVLAGLGARPMEGGVAGRRGYDETTETLATPRGGRCKLRRGLRLRR